MLAGKTITSVARGNSNTVVLTSDGGLYTWGLNNLGQLGNGTTNNSNVPVAVTIPGTPLAGKTVVAIAAGGGHCLAIDDNGAIYGWGDNRFGQLADGTQNTSGTSRKLTPVLIDPTGTPMAGKTITSAAAGNLCNIARASDGTLYSWGFNERGQLGDGTTILRTRPVAVLTSGALAGKTLTAIACGDSHTLARTADGLLFAWGFNGSGALGVGDTADRLSPVAVTGGALTGKSVVSVAGGNAHTVVATADGLAIAWGSNSNGQVGDNTTNNRSLPTSVQTTGTPMAGRTITDVAAESASTVVLSSDPLAFAWGSNDTGQLGNGKTTQSLVPVKVTVAGG